MPPALLVDGEKWLGISVVFWTGAALTLAVAFLLRYSAPAGAFRPWVRTRGPPGWRACMSGRMSSSRTRRRGPSTGWRRSCLPASAPASTRSFGDAYLLAPIAAVVIAGASLSGGLASATSTWVAALALMFLTQMLLILGLWPGMQFIVFGAAIIVGMLISGDRIASLLGRVLRQIEGGGQQLWRGGKHELRLAKGGTMHGGKCPQRVAGADGSGTGVRPARAALRGRLAVVASGSRRRPGRS